MIPYPWPHAWPRSIFWRGVLEGLNVANWPAIVSGTWKEDSIGTKSTSNQIPNQMPKKSNGE
jgi:hypothetical protein